MIIFYRGPMFAKGVAMSFSSKPLNGEWVTTKWSTDFGVGPDGLEGRKKLLIRYWEAVSSYFRSAIRDQNVADELASDFALRLLETDRLVRGADREKGRFRHYLKAVLRNMIADYGRKKSKVPTTTLGNDIEGTVEPADFISVWRQTLINRAWKALAANCSKEYVAILRCKSENEDLSAADIAERLAPELGTLHTERNVRQILSRARKAFAGFLLEEVEVSLENPSREDLEAELCELQLMPYCKKILSERA